MVWLHTDHERRRIKTFRLGFASFGTWGRPGIYVEGTNQKLIHYVVRTEENPNLPLTGRAKALQMQLLQELADRGEDAEAARADNKRWGKIQTPSQLAELNLEEKAKIKEREERLKKEKEEKAANAKKE